MIVETAFKEWAAVCAAIALGRQTVILRKGGIADNAELEFPHPRFWLFPTYYHTDSNPALKAEDAGWLTIAESLRPENGRIELRTLVEVIEVKRLQSLEEARTFDAQHILAPETVEQRFHYRSPELTAMTVRAWTRAWPLVLEVHPDYAGCKIWLNLKKTHEVPDVFRERSCL